ncbi:hypothetical protein ACJVC5_19765 [Peredibacter sp. HCB2-198]|uniref:Lipoprotein n=1 Tax=Peredibacter starrii TaxID=28202 RepID=A0AAX4HM36_9BACT|nr:hypothetical protein [Peredibacter starrii]WPU64260.1 hypothetical protein SOO65_16320 [Peredibacter starrii]
MMKLMSVLLILSLGVACSSKKKVKDVDNSETIARDYEVRDASSTVRPGWIEDAEVWVAQENMDTKKFRYFSYETEPKVNREIACNLAKANVRSDIASEITTFIQKSLAASTEGQAAIDANNPKTAPMREYVSNTLAERVQSLIHGAAVIKTYWEKRNYQQKLGAKKDHVGFTCATLIRMEDARLKAAIDKASEDLVEKADPELKDNVKKALENLDEDFVKARHGEV